MTGTRWWTSGARGKYKRPVYAGHAGRRKQRRSDGTHHHPRRAHHLHYGAHADQRSGRGGAYTGAAYEGIAFLPWVGAKLNPVLKPLFGFTSPEAIAVPVTALGAAGASIGLILPMIRSGLAVGNDIAVFTAMCMCWSGYLSTHVAMMDSLHCSDMTGKAIFSHTIGGLVAGIAAHWIYVLIVL